MAASQLVSLIQYVARQVRDTSFTYFSANDIEEALRNHETELRGLPVRRDTTRKVFLPDSSVYHEIGFLSSDAVLNTAQDQTGTVKTANTINYFTPRFAFTTADDANVLLYIFGNAYHPWKAAADLIEVHPNPEDLTQLSRLRIMDFSATFANAGGGKSFAERLRARRPFLNRKYAGQLTEVIVDPYEVN